jgi:acyl-CoA-binding protein
MSDLDTTFEAAIKFVQNSGDDKSVEITNSDKLQFYALFKQSQKGECKDSAPSRFKMVERAKYDAYKKLGKMTKDEAKKAYIELVKSKTAKFSPKL